MARFCNKSPGATTRENFQATAFALVQYNTRHIMIALFKSVSYLDRSRLLLGSAYPKELASSSASAKERALLPQNQVQLFCFISEAILPNFQVIAFVTLQLNSQQQLPSIFSLSVFHMLQFCSSFCSDTRSNIYLFKRFWSGLYFPQGRSLFSPHPPSLREGGPLATQATSLCRRSR